MLKKVLILILLILWMVFIIFAIFLNHDDQSEYPTTGRDLHEYFGDARFVILNGHDENGNNTLILYDEKTIKTIEEDIKIYDEINGYVYLIGDRGYTKLNYETGEIMQESSLESFGEKDKRVFVKFNIISEYTIIGKYTCSNDYWKDDFFIQNPEKVPFILFEDNNNCSILVNYLGGLANVKCSYSIEKNTVKVKAYLAGTPFDGTYDDGRPYMEDEYIFNIMDDNNIIIDKGFYTVGAGDKFIKK